MGLTVGTTLADTLLVSDNPEPYVVRQGDTLWDISGRFLTKPWRWPELWEINSHIENPHLIYPGDIVRLVYESGQPQLLLERADGTGAGTPGAGSPADAADAADAIAGETATAERTGERDFKLSPSVRETKRSRQAVPPISLEEIQPFLSYMRVTSDDGFKGWPYVLTSIKDGRNSITMGDEGVTVHVRGKLSRAIRKYSVYRDMRELRSPRVPEQILGYELMYVGDYIVSDYGRDDEDSTRGRMVNQILPVEKGDRLYPYAEERRDESLNFVPHAPPPETRGQIIAIIDGVRSVGGNNVVALDVGSKDGVKPGALLHIYNRAVAFEDEVSARLQAELEAKKPVRFKGEETNVITKGFSGMFNRIRNLKNALDSTPLVQFLGSPQAKPDKVVVLPEYSGQLMVFRSFESTSYALVLEVDTPSYIEDIVLSPEADVREGMAVTAGL